MNKRTNGIAGAGIIAAVAASLCCITPILALISGISGLAGLFSWIEPVRPYFIFITVAVLLLAWYLKLKPVKTEVQCNCEENKKPSLWHSKGFLGIVTLFAALMLAFPYYSRLLYPEKKPQTETVGQKSSKQLKIDVEGMTCKACNHHIEYATGQLNGVLKVTADYKSGTAEIIYNPTVTNKSKIADAINKTGYRVSGETKNKTRETEQ